MHRATSSPCSVEDARVTLCRSPLGASSHSKPSRALNLAAFPSCALVPVSMTVKDYVSDFPLFHGRHFRFMHNERGKVVFVDPVPSGSHTTALWTWYRRWQVFNWNGDLLRKADLPLLAMPHIRCPEEGGNVGCLINFVAPLRCSPAVRWYQRHPGYRPALW